MLTWIKLVHTAVWCCLSLAVLYLPVAGLQRKFRPALALTGLILAECAILAVNRGRCPLTNIAAHYTKGRADNFDIYLPLWLAHYNKTIFGALFLAGEAVVLWQWVAFKRQVTPTP